MVMVMVTFPPRVTLAKVCEIIFLDTFASTFARVGGARFYFFIAQFALIALLAYAFEIVLSQLANSKYARIYIANCKRAKQT